MSLSLNLSDYQWLNSPSLDRQNLAHELMALTDKVRVNMQRFGHQFPSASTLNNVYRIKNNDDWTNGFWSGMQAIGYLFSGDAYFLAGLESNLVSFRQRLEQHLVLDHHDIGFLYSLSAGALYKINHDTEAKQLLIAAADVLLNRFQDQGQFIQAWGQKGDPAEYRLIIDSLLNLPLLYLASELSRESKYREIADRHFDTVISTIFREDFSTYHTYYFDPNNGLPLEGKTFQGFSDTSCWARGQAWAILGLPLVWRLSQRAPDRERYDAVCGYFLRHLPAEGIPYWDLSFTATDKQPYDTSALAIAICGLLEADRLFGDGDYRKVAAALQGQLTRYASASSDLHCEGLLKHGVYAFAQNKGIDECNLWGDYFYMEAIYRLYHPDWKGFW